AILRARLDVDDPTATIEPFSWGYRNGYAIRFAPQLHALKGGLLVGEDGADERARGRPTTRPTCCSWPNRTPTAVRTTPAGRTAPAPCRRPGRCSRGSRGPATTSGSRAPKSLRACARQRASPPS